MCFWFCIDCMLCLLLLECGACYEYPFAKFMVTWSLWYGDANILVLGNFLQIPFSYLGGLYVAFFICKWGVINKK